LRRWGPTAWRDHDDAPDAGEDADDEDRFGEQHALGDDGADGVEQLGDDEHEQESIEQSQL
jgi:hypothetical protein